MTWALIGSRAHHCDFFICGAQYVSTPWLLLWLIVRDRYLILSALSLDSILHLDVCRESWKGATFYRFIEGLLDSMNPSPERNSVLDMDNASIHHSPKL
jgi:hypothetical protein